MARNKAEALGMGFLSAVFEGIIEGLDPDGAQGRDLVAEMMIAFSDGIFDSGYDQWASGQTVTQTHGPIVGNGQVSVAPFYGFFHPFIIMGRAGLQKSLKGEGRLDSRELFSTLIGASLAYLTNKSGIGFEVRLPASVRQRVAEVVTKLALIPPGQNFTDVADEIARDIARFWDPALKGAWEFIGRGAKEIPEE